MGSISSVPSGVSFAAVTGASSCSSGTCASPPNAERATAPAAQPDSYVSNSGQGQQQNSLYSFASGVSYGNAPSVSPNDQAAATPDQLSALSVETQARQQQTNLFTPAPNLQHNISLLA